MARVNEEFPNFEAKLSNDNPIADYEKLMDDKMKADVIVPTGVFNLCWKKISNATRETIWKMLFDEQKLPVNDNFKKVSELLKMHRDDACVYQADEYNKWIVLVRDELLKRNMLDFWRDEIVEKEFGPCWARSSGLFDDTADPEPANFYKYAGCEAPWLKKKNTAAQNTADIVPSSLMNIETPKNKALKKLSTETPLQDYKYNMDLGEIWGDDIDVYNRIFKKARDMVWLLLFGESALTAENSIKAAELLQEYKQDACFLWPWDYNDWIPKVKEELIRRKYIYRFLATCHREK